MRSGTLLDEGNPESWQWVVGFYEELTARPHWQHLLPLLQLVRQIRDSDYAQSFRGGQSLDALIISTAAQHGLTPDDPRIAVIALRPEWNSILFQVESNSTLLQIMYGEDEYLCEADELWNALVPLLSRLWNDTHGEAAL